MPIKVECICGKSLMVQDKFKGKRGTCKACGHKFIVGKKVEPRETSTKKKGKKKPTSMKHSGSSAVRASKRPAKAKRKGPGVSTVVIIATLVILAGIGGYFYFKSKGNGLSTPDQIESIVENGESERSGSEGTASTTSENRPFQTDKKTAKILGPNEFPVGIWQDGDKVFVLGRNGTFLSNLVDMSEGVWSYDGDTLSIEYALLAKSYKDFDGKVFKTGPQGGTLKEIDKASPLPSDFVLLGNWKGPKEAVNILGSGSFSSSIPNFEKGFYRLLDGYIQLVSASRLILAYKDDGSLVNPVDGSSFKQQ